MPYQGGFMIILTGWQWVHNMEQQTEHKILEKISKDEYKYHEKNFDQTDTVKLNQDGAKGSHFRDLITTWNGSMFITEGASIGRISSDA